MNPRGAGTLPPAVDVAGAALSPDGTRAAQLDRTGAGNRTYRWAEIDLSEWRKAFGDLEAVFESVDSMRFIEAQRKIDAERKKER